MVFKNVCQDSIANLHFLVQLMELIIEVGVAVPCAVLSLYAFLEIVWVADVKRKGQWKPVVVCSLKRQLS